MSRTPDAYDGPRIDEAVIWEEQTSDPAENLRQQYVQNKGLLILADGVVRPLGEGRLNAWQPPVDDRGVNTPPGSPTTGYRVIVGSSPTGAFVGHAGEIAQWTGTAWVFSTPRTGTAVHVKDEAQSYCQTALSMPWSWNVVVGLHAATHFYAGSDQINAQDLGSGAALSGKLLQANGSGGWNLVDYVPGYPTALEYSSDDTVSTTTSATFITKLLHTTMDLDLGHYLIFAQAVLSGSANNTETEGQILLDGTTIIQSVTARLSRVDAEFVMMSMYVLDEVSGVHTLAIRYRKSGGSGSASIRAARIILWRIS